MSNETKNVPADALRFAGELQFNEDTNTDADGNTLTPFSMSCAIGRTDQPLVLGTHRPRHGRNATCAKTRCPVDYNHRD